MLLATVLSGENLLSEVRSLDLCLELEDLRLHNNSLSSVPQSIGALTKLRRLYLANNDLQTMPSLRSCVHLQDLELQHNKFAAPPDGIDALEQLEILDVLTIRDLSSVLRPHHHFFPAVDKLL